MNKNIFNIIISILIMITPLFWNQAMWVIDSYFTGSLVLYLSSVVSTIIGLLFLSKVLEKNDRN